MARRITRRRRPSPFMFGLGSLAKRRRRKSSGLAAASRKACVNAKGKLRKGFKFGKGGRCVRAKKH